MSLNITSSLRSLSQVQTGVQFFQSFKEFAGFLGMVYVGLVAGGLLNTGADIGLNGSFAIGYKKRKGSPGSVKAFDIRRGLNTKGESVVTVALDIERTTKSFKRLSGRKYRLQWNRTTNEVSFQFGANINLYKLDPLGVEIAKLDAVARTNIPINSSADISDISLKAGLEANYLSIGRFGLTIFEIDANGSYSWFGRGLSGGNIF